MNTRFKSLTDTPRVTFAQFQAIGNDVKEGFYPGVLVIENGPAKGHYAVKLDSGRVVNFNYEDPDHAELKKYPIFIDNDTLKDVVNCGNLNQKVKCKLDHGSTVKDIIGSYTNFRMEGDKVRADLTLLKSYPHRDYVEEMIAEMQKDIGNSIDFDYTYEIQGDKAIARCVKLNSVDIVDTPAATNSLFEENKHANTDTHMPLSKEDLAAIRGELKEEVASQLGAVTKDFNSRFEALKTQLEEGEKKEDDEEKKDDEKKVEDKDNDKMSALIEKTVLSAMKKAMPKAPLADLSSEDLSKGKQPNEYDAKFNAAREAGMSEGQAVAFMARKHPALYNQKFGAKATL